MFKKSFFVGIIAMIIFSVAAPIGYEVAYAKSDYCPTKGFVCCKNPPDCNFNELIATIENIMVEMIKISLYFTAIVFVYAGYLYLTSAGNSGKISQAHSMLTKVVIGLLIILSAYLIVEGIAKALGLDSTFLEYLI